MDRHLDPGQYVANPSGAPAAGGATTRGSVFGGQSWFARAWRLLARIARDLEATAYRRLRDMEAERTHASHPGEHRDPGAPRRVKRAFEKPGQIGLDSAERT
jgi:hypothetical protein